MGYGEFGGTGSVEWKVDVDDSGKAGKKRASAFGRDDKSATEFTVTIHFDSAGTASTAWSKIQTALSGLGSNAKKLVFKIPVEADNSGQLKIEW